MIKPPHEQLILEQARNILLKRITQPGGVISNIDEVQQYLVMEYGTLENEQFGCMFLNSSYGLINHNRMFRGTIDQCATYPREIVREALLQNAVFVVLIHNHPAHKTTPSSADIVVTKTVQALLNSLGMVLFDHIIVAGMNMYSMRTGGHLD